MRPGLQQCIVPGTVDWDGELLKFGCPGLPLFGRLRFALAIAGDWYGNQSRGPRRGRDAGRVSTFSVTACAAGLVRKMSVFRLRAGRLVERRPRGSDRDQSRAGRAPIVGGSRGGYGQRL